MSRIAGIRMGTSNVYLVEDGEDYLLVDAGSLLDPKAKLAKAFQRLGVDPRQIRLLVLTHVHYDHVRGLKAIKDMCSCPVAVHRAEADDLAQGRMLMPQGHTTMARAVAWLGRTFKPAFTRIEAHEADIVVRDQMSLAEYGIAGRLQSTPGHTAGSMSLILDDGQALVGDTIFNYYPFGRGPIMPPFANDLGRLMETWRYLISQKIKVYFPGHGPSLPGERLAQAYLKHADIGTVQQ